MKDIAPSSFLAQAIIGIALLFIANLSWGYEQETHDLISTVAADRSVLNETNGTLLAELGLDPYGELELPSSVGAPLRVPQLIALGAREEDEPGHRALNHFYNPQHDNFAGSGLLFQARPLTFPFQPYLSIGNHASPDWALEPNGPLQFIDLVQDHSYRDARRYFNAAVTAPSRRVREQQLALMFEALGHVIHHIQDMAQPQHVRNDAHVPLQGGTAVIALIASYLGNQPVGRSVSEYERYTGQKYPDLLSLLQELPPAGSMIGDRPPTYTSVRDFWSTSLNSPPYYRGLAEYVSGNYLGIGSLLRVRFPFLSNDINDLIFTPHPDGLTPLPDGTTARVEKRSVRVVHRSGPDRVGDMLFVVRDINDQTPNHVFAINPPPKPVAALSLVASFSLLRSQEANVVMNRYVYDALHEDLLPKAVRFSSGILNHFFRGKISMERATEESSDWVITNVGGVPLSGTFSLYFEDSSGTRQRYGAAPGNLAPGQSVTIAAPEPPEATTELTIATFTGSVGNDPGNTNELGAARVVQFQPRSQPSIPCGTEISESGGVGGFSETMDVGTAPGPIPVSFEAYRIPDALTIRANGSSQALLSTNGLVSGRHDFTINYDHEALGTRYLDVNVDAPEPGTAWWVTVGCPGDPPLPNNELPVQQRYVEWTFQPALVNGLRCNFDFYIDGQYVRRVFRSARFFVWMSVGPHNLEYRNRQCDDPLPTADYSFTATYRDGVGTEAVAHPFFRNNWVYDIR